MGKKSQKNKTPKRAPHGKGEQQEAVPKWLIIAGVFIGALAIVWICLSDDTFYSNNPTEIRQYLDVKLFYGDNIKKGNQKNIERFYQNIISDKSLSEDWWTTNDARWIAMYSSDIILLHKSFEILREQPTHVDSALMAVERILSQTNFQSQKSLKLQDQVTKMLIASRKHKAAINWLRRSLDKSGEHYLVNRWKGFLLQELILIEDFDTAKEIASHCVEEYRASAADHFPFFCYQQLGTLYTMEGNHENALDIFLEEYRNGVKTWQKETGEKCETTKHIPVAISQVEPFIADLLPPKFVNNFKMTYSDQAWPFYFDSATQSVREWRESFQEMKIFGEKEKTGSIYALNNVTVLGRNKWIIVNDDNDVDCSLYTFSFPYTNSMAIPRYTGSHPVPWNSLPVKKLHRAIVVHFADYNHYHMSIEVLAQLILTIQQPEFQNEDYVILVSYSPTASQLLEFLGFIEYCEIYQWSEFQYHIDEAFVIDWRFLRTHADSIAKLDGQEYYAPPAAAINIVREFITQMLPSSVLTSKQNLVVFVHRDNGPRSISNFQPLYEELAEKAKLYGFTFVVHRSDLTIAQQIELFSKAKVVIGVHGAGLANILYCKPQTSIIEIPAYPLKVSVYSRMASALNLRYWVVPSSQIFHYSEDNVFTTKQINDISNTLLHILAE